MNTNDNRLKAHKLIDHIFQDLLPAHGMAQRSEQIQLSHRMLDAMQDGRIALCDAGTGIGKTYAYLAAATAASAFPTGQIARPIIISTSSIALQNAVLTEYLPLLSCVLMADGILTKPLKAVIRKGKSHYVCDERLDRRLRQVYPAKKNPEALTALRTLRETLDMDRVSHLSSYDRERVGVPQVCDCKQRDCRYPDARKERELEKYSSLRAFIREVAVPEMQIKLRQGFGRAIRTESDTCVIAILDERACRGRRYAQAVSEALPEMRRTGSLREVTRFLREKKPESYFEVGR